MKPTKKPIQKSLSNLKLAFDKKRLEDQAHVRAVLEHLDKLKTPIEEHLEAFKSKSNSDLIKAVGDLKTALDKKKLEVKVAPAKIVVPKPLVKILKETKEAEKMVKLLEQYLKFNLKAYQQKDGGTFITNRDPQDAVPVVLTDAGLKKFYNAIHTAVSQSQDPFVNPSGHRRPANVDAEGNLIVDVSIDSLDIELDHETSSIAIWSNTAADGSGTDLQPLLDADGHLQVDILSMPALVIAVSNFPAEYPLPDAQVTTLTPPAAITGFATETTLQALEGKDFATQTTLAAILAKIIAAPATEAKQDVLNALITSLNATDFATENSLQDLLALLSSIDFAMDSTLQDVLSQVTDVVNGLQDIVGIINTAEIRSPSAPLAVTVNASSTTVLSSNANRRGLYITNTSTANQVITLRSTAAAAVMWEGIVLYPGGVYKMEREDFHTNEMRGIASAAGGRLSIQEYT